jgi:hypothetical protein
MGKERKFHKISVGKPEERDHSEDRSVVVRMGSEWILGRLAGWGVEWIQLAQDRVWWWALASAVMNPRVLAPMI